MSSNANKSEVESRLRETADSMSDRLSALQEEVSSTGTSLRNWIAKNPIKSVAGMLAAGLAVGLITGGSRSTSQRRHQRLLQAYIDSLRNEVEAAVERGEAPGAALEQALENRVPLVVYSQDGNVQENNIGWSRYFARQGADILFSTGMSLVAKEAIEGMLSNVDIDEMIEELEV